jgi:N4-gp56 family major capsid protein
VHLQEANFMATTWTSKGGYLSFDRLSAKLRYATQQISPLMQFVRDEPKLGGNKGDTVNITKIYNATREYPTTPLSETAPIPANDWTQNQVSLTLDEWGDSFDLTEKFTTLSDFDPNDITTRLLMDSMKKNQNYLIATELKKTALKYAPTSATAATAGTFTKDGTDPGNFARALNKTDLYALRDAAIDTYRLPPLTGPISEVAQYAMACSQHVISAFMQDSDIANALNYSYMGNGNGNPLLKGSLGVFNGVIFYLDTQNFATTQDTFSGEAVFFGDDAVVSGTAIYPELRRKDGVDYGRDPGVAWYGIYNFKIVGGASQAEVDAYQARAIHLTSSAN